MAGKTTKSRKAKPKKESKKSGKPDRRSLAKPTPKPLNNRISIPVISAQLSRESAVAVLPPNRIFSINLGTISGDTTIGDLIVAFPRTREVLMKHGLRFNVEEAGYLYMTLNVFSAIHGLATHNLVQELHTASKEPQPQPTTTQLRPIPATQTA